VTIVVNDSSHDRIDAVPTGSVEGSRSGREEVRFAVQEMTEPMSLCLAPRG
jgi:hypothetical protein